MNTQTPELDKQRAVIESGASDTLTEFYDWLTDERGYVIAEWDAGERAYFSIGWSPETLFAQFFGIDLKKIESERRAILEELRNG